MENWNSFNATISDEDSSIVMAQLLEDHNPSFGMQTMVWSGHDVCLEDDANFSSSYLWSQEPHLASYYSMDGDKMSLIGNSTSIGNDLIDTSTAKRKLDIGRNEEDVLPVESLNKKPRISKKVERSCSFSSESESNSSKQSSGMTLNCKTRASKGTATDPQSLYARKRRERINQRLRILQTLVPNGTKVDISTMLEQAVQYVKFLQLQIKLLSSDELWMYAPFAYNGMNTGLDLNIFPPEK